MKNIIVTPEKIFSINYCKDSKYSLFELEKMITKNGMTLLDILFNDNIANYYDKLWTFLRRDFCDSKELLLMRKRFIEEILEYWINDDYIPNKVKVICSIYNNKSIEDCDNMIISDDEKKIFEKISNKFEEYMEKNDNIRIYEYFFRCFSSFCRIRKYSFDDDNFYTAYHCCKVVELLDIINKTKNLDNYIQKQKLIIKSFIEI